MAKHHPSLLESFEQGWNNLTSHLKARFHDPITNRLPAYFRSLPKQATRFLAGNLHFLRTARWTSWTSFAFTELGESEAQYLISTVHASRVSGLPLEYGGLYNVLA